jgi:hypothetical protein
VLRADAVHEQDCHAASLAEYLSSLLIG